jgi:hypothetical protein
MRWLALGAALLVAGAGIAQAVTVADLEFKDPLWGDPVEPTSLKDRVVVVYYWAAD